MGQRKIIQIAYANYILYALWDDGTVSRWDSGNSSSRRDGTWRDLVWETDHGTEQGAKISQKESEEKE